MADDPVSPTMSVVTAAPPNMDGVLELMEIMRSTMEQLGGTFETLGQTTTKIDELQAEPALDSVSQIQALRKHLVLRDRRQAEEIEEIQRHLSDVLQNEIVDYLDGQIELQIQDMIDAEVEAQVADQLKYYIPQELQDAVSHNRRSLSNVQFSLHNAESRRANGLIKVNDLRGSLHTMMMPDGKVSEHFPKDLTTLVTMPGDTVNLLIADYSLVPSDSREKNLNTFMQFCNIGYQVVPYDSSSALMS